MPANGLQGTILVVDDEPTVTRAASRLLRSMGFKVLVATDGGEAVGTCRARVEEIDLLLLDFALPQMTGIETVRQLRSLSPGIKVILTSGYTRQESVARFGDIRLDGFIQKPFGYTELENAARTAVARAPRPGDE